MVEKVEKVNSNMLFANFNKDCSCACLAVLRFGQDMEGADTA